jgi:hypothetical protein
MTTTKSAATWKNASDYPSASDTSLDRWAWEFLRRNSNFKAEMKQAKQEQANAKEAGTLDIAWNRQPVGIVLERWGVALPYLPEWIESLGLDSPVRFDAYPRDMEYATIEGRGYKFALARQSTRCLEFDLTAPIPPQLEKAKRMLLASQEMPALKELGVRSRNNEQTAMFPRYLQLLDAIAAGAARKEIADYFGDGDDKIARQIEKAEALRNGGYQGILEK